MINSMKKRTYVVGDVHGCCRELQHLLDKIQPRYEDTVIFAGDLLDKGPDSAGVVRTARELADRCSVVLVKGNHEEKHERFRRHEHRISLEGGTNPITQANKLREVAKELSGADVVFLEQAVLYHQVPEHDVLVVHAGISPWITKLPDLSRPPSRRYNEMLRVRALDENGRFLTLDEYGSLPAQERQNRFWAHRYDGRFGHVYFGHEPFESVQRFQHATGIDTGCCFGGELTAVELSTGELFSVSAFDAYAERLSFNS